MKKRLLIFLVTLITLFSSSQVFAKDISDKKITEEIVNVEEIIENLDEVSKEQDKITDNELNNTIDEVIKLQEHDLQNERDFRDKLQKGVNGTNKVIDIVNRQIQMKSQFIQNIIEVYNTAAKIEKDMISIKNELNDIITSNERDLTGEEYEQIKKSIKELKREAKEADYIAGSILKETKNYIGHVRKKEFRKAIISFERIVELQQQQIEMLKTLEKNTSRLKEDLSKVGYK